MKSFIAGLIIIALGAVPLFFEMKSPPVHSAHIYVFIAIAFIGAVVLDPGPIIEALKQLAAIVAPYIPMIRKGDGT